MYVFIFHTAYKFITSPFVLVKFVTLCPFVYFTVLELLLVLHPWNVYPVFVNVFIESAFDSP